MATWSKSNQRALRRISAARLVTPPCASLARGVAPAAAHSEVVVANKTTEVITRTYFGGRLQLAR